MHSNSLILVAGGEAADREIILQALNDDFHVVAAQTMEDALAHVEDSVGLVICDFLPSWMVSSTKAEHESKEISRIVAALFLCQYVCADSSMRIRSFHIAGHGR